MEDFQHDIVALRQKIETLEAEKAKREREFYDREVELEDKLEKAENDARHYKKFSEARVLNAQPGDIFVVDNHEFIQAYSHEFLAMAKFNRCMFVVLPTGGLDHIAKLPNEDLARIGLKKIDQ